MRPVVLDVWAGSDWIVESGLSPGDRVIIDHLMQVRPGMLVEPRLEPAGAPADTNAR